MQFYRSWGHCWDAREELQRAILEKQGLPRLNFWGGSGKSPWTLSTPNQTDHWQPTSEQHARELPYFFVPVDLCKILQTNPKNNQIGQTFH